MSERYTRARVAGALLLAVAVAIGAEASTFEVAFVTDAIGPKALPFLVAVILAVAALGQIFRPDIVVTWPERSSGVRMVGAVAAFVSYAALLPFVGFFLSTTGVVTALSSLYGGPARRSAAAAAVLSGVLWLVFVALLDLPLPIGELWMR